MPPHFFVMHTTPARALITAALLALVVPLTAAPKIGVLMKARGEPGSFWGALEQGATEAGKQAGAEILVKAPPSETEISIQIQYLNALAAQGAQAIVIAPINKEALAVPIASVAIKGVKVVVIDTPLTGNAAPVFIGTDHEAAGKAAGTFLSTLIGDTDEIGLFRNSQASGATVQRDNGALAAIRGAHPNAVVFGEIYASSEPGKEQEKAVMLLEKHPNMKAILATGTPGTLAMLKVLQDKKLDGKIKLVGFGFNLSPNVAAAIESGAMSAWIAQLPKDIGAKGVNSAISLLKGETVPPIVYTDFLVITKDNLKDPKVQALLSL
jgi:ribose transport system substrate-binding protein